MSQSQVPLFPLSAHLLPEGRMYLRIFEPRYIDMINDSMKSNKMIGMIQPKSSQYTEPASKREPQLPSENKQL